MRRQTIEAIREEEPHSYGLECEYFLTNKDSLPFRVLEEETPLEKSRIYGPFPSELVHWLMLLSQRNPVENIQASFTLSHDADGREYLEY